MKIRLLLTQRPTGGKDVLLLYADGFNRVRLELMPEVFPRDEPLPVAITVEMNFTQAYGRGKRLALSLTTAD